MVGKYENKNLRIYMYLILSCLIILSKCFNIKLILHVLINLNKEGNCQKKTIGQVIKQLNQSKN